MNSCVYFILTLTNYFRLTGIQCQTYQTMQAINYLSQCPFTINHDWLAKAVLD